MTAGDALPFPGGRTLAGWWRQFAPLGPRELAAGHFLVQRLEALVRLRRRAEPEPLQRFLLRTLAASPNLAPASLDAHLHLGEPLVNGLLDELRHLGLARSSAEAGW